MMVIKRNFVINGTICDHFFCVFDWFGGKFRPSDVCCFLSQVQIGSIVTAQVSFYTVVWLGLILDVSGTHIYRNLDFGNNLWCIKKVPVKVSLLWQTKPSCTRS